MKSQSVSINAIPQDVWKAWVLRTSPIGVGVEGIKFIEATIKKYPEYFEWEVKFNAIPESVYEAYLDEVYPDRHKKVDWNNWDEFTKEGNQYNGIIPEIHASNQKTYSKNPTNQDMLECLTWFKDQLDKEHERKINERKEEARKKTIWNKHYKKYGLKYRSDALHF